MTRILSSPRHVCCLAPHDGKNHLRTPQTTTTTTTINSGKTEEVTTRLFLHNEHDVRTSRPFFRPNIPAVSLDQQFLTGTRHISSVFLSFIVHLVVDDLSLEIEVVLPRLMYLAGWVSPGLVLKLAE